jgi:tetratricopeptide (TPR) repeat protein
MQSGVMARIAAVLALLAAGSPAQTLEQLAVLAQQAAAAQNAGNYQDAERLHRQVLDGVTSLPGFPPSDRARQMSNLASVLNIEGKAPEALGLLRAAEALLKTNPSTDPAQIVTLHFNFAQSHALQREWNLAEQRYQDGFQILESENALESIQANEGLAGLAFVYGHTGRVAQAKTLYEKVLPYFRQLAGADHPTVKRWQHEYDALTAN